MGKKTLIIGSTNCGISAAKRLRFLDESIEISIIERNNNLSANMLSLPHYVTGIITEKDALLPQSHEELASWYNINFIFDSEVTSIDTINKAISIRNNAGETFKEIYDYLIFSQDLQTKKNIVSCCNSNKIFKLDTISDAELLRKSINNNKYNDIIILGGDILGVELASNLIRKGLNVSLVDTLPHILPQFDGNMAVYAEKQLLENGVDLHLDNEVTYCTEYENKISLTLRNHAILNGDILISTYKEYPNTTFLKDSGIETTPSGHIIVNENMETNIDSIYAIGCCTQLSDYNIDSKYLLSFSNSSAIEAIIAADNIAGIYSDYRLPQQNVSLEIFNVTGAATGSGEEKLKELNMDFNTIYFHAAEISLKLIFDSNGFILGAQAFGNSETKNIINIISTVMELGGTVDTLGYLGFGENSKSPSTLDILNIAGSTAENVLTHRNHQIYCKDLEYRKTDDTILIDVRSKMEYEQGSIIGSINVPLEELRSKLSLLTKEKEIIVYCQTGIRGFIAERILTSYGFNAKNLSGGYETHIISKNSNKSDFNTLDQLESTITTKSSSISEQTIKYTASIDARGISCPGPLLKVSSKMNLLKDSDILKVIATDAGFYSDIQAWCKRTNCELLNISRDNGIISAFIKKGQEEFSEVESKSQKDNKTLIVFSGDLDKAIASFIIANGAVSMGKKVTMFFTFWGLNIIRKPHSVKVKKGIIDKMFGFMMPRGSKNLKLSKMNMMGIGSKLIRTVMKNKNIYSLESLIKNAIDNGVELIACQMSMDVMGIKNEELIDGVKIGGVGYYLGETEDSNLNLFI